MEHIWLILLGLAGLAISLYIRINLANKKKLVCVLGGNCNRVVTSSYANIFGLDNTILGIAYYALIVGLGVAQFFAPAFFALPGAYWAKVAISSGAFHFSLYLTFVQAFILKDWCQWCIMSALVSTAIFFVAL